MPSHTKVALRALERQLAPRQLLTDPVSLMTYEYDASLDRGLPDGVVFPNNAAEVEQIVRWANEYNVPVIARGAGTGLSGGAIAEHGGIIMHFSHMNRVLEFDVSGRSAVVQPGLVNQSLDELVKTRGLYFPPDPSSGRSSTLGGNIAENSGGPHCFKYGVTTNYVSGLNVVLADGKQVRLGGRATDYPEYDLLGVMIGSEGTLGIVTEASVRLIRNAPAVKTMMVAFDSIEAAGEAVSALIAEGLIPATLEMMDQKMMRIIEDFAHAGLPTEAGAALIVEVDGFSSSVGPQMDEISAIMQRYNASDMRIAQTAAQRDAIWYGRKSAVGAMSRLAPAYYLVDVTVPRSKLATTLAGVNRICEEMNLRVGYVFHAGDGNLHPLILIEDPNNRELLKHVMEAGRRIVEICVAFDGSITGEHGVGIEKRDLMPLMYSEVELDVMRQVKRLFDPRDLMNPHKIFPPAGELPPRPVPSAPPTESEVAPATSEEAASVLHSAIAAGRTVRVRGAGTKSAGLSAADLTISTSNLAGVRTFARDDLYVTVGAGTPLSALQEELGRDRFWVPLVSPWPESTIGGIVACNWNAPLRMRYGGLRDQLLAATVAMTDGRVIRAGRPVVKNVAGYDLPKLFVGSYGTLGLICDVTLKIAPLPRAQQTLIVPVVDLQQGLEWGAQLRQICLNASALLLCRDTAITAQQGGSAPYALVYSIEGVELDVEAEIAEVQSALKALGAPAAVVLEGTTGSNIWADWMREASSVPALRVGVAVKDLDGLLPTLQGASSDTLSFVADLASGLLYVRGLADLGATQRAAQQLGGYAQQIGAPAVGDRWGHAPDALDLMRALRKRWGGDGLLNPGAFVV